MYINNDRIYFQDHNCKDCENNSICKYSADMSITKEYLKGSPIKTGFTPIKIKVVCDNFKKKAQRQDGFNNWSSNNRGLY